MAVGHKYVLANFAEEAKERVRITVSRFYPVINRFNLDFKLEF